MTTRVDDRGQAYPAAELATSVDTELFEFRDAVQRIRLTKPGLVAKQVHAELLAENGEKWAATTISEVKRMCSKLPP